MSFVFTNFPRSFLRTILSIFCFQLGRFGLYQPFMLPGNILMNLKVSASTVVGDIVENVCAEIGVTQAGSVMEFGLFVFTSKFSSLICFSGFYLLDVFLFLFQKCCLLFRVLLYYFVSFVFSYQGSHSCVSARHWDPLGMVWTP